MSWLRRVLGLGPSKTEHMMSLLAATQAALDDVRSELDATKEQLQAQQKREPDIQIKSSGISPSGDVMLEMEWNDEFIEHLHERGYRGATEDDTVNLWLNSIMARFNRPDMVNNILDDLDTPSFPIDQIPPTE